MTLSVSMPLVKNSEMETYFEDAFKSKWEREIVKFKLYGLEERI